MSNEGCVIFDFDGVILDTEDINYTANQLAFEATGLSFSREEYKKLWIVEGLDLQDIVERYQLNTDPEEIRRKKNDYCRETIASSAIKISDDVRAAIEAIISDNWRLAIGSSNSETDIQLFLEKNHLKQSFTTIVGLESVPKVKPAPDIFLECLKRMKASPRHSFVIEDAPKGITAAKRANISTVIAIPNNWTAECDFSEADIVLHSFQDLPDVII